MPTPRTIMDGQTGDVRAFPTDRPGADRMCAGDRSQQAGLAHSVATQQAGDRTDFGGQGDLPQRDGGAVVQIDVVDFKHRTVGPSPAPSRGFITSARAMASCCCCPPDRSPPRRRSIVFSTGNSSNTSSGTRRCAARQHGKAGLQVFAHRQQRKDVAALRHPGDAAPRAVVDRQPRDVGAFPADRARADRMRAGDRAQQAGLAHAVAAEQAGHRARLRRSATPGAARWRRRSADRHDRLQASSVSTPSPSPSTRVRASHDSGIIVPDTLRPRADRR